MANINSVTDGFFVTAQEGFVTTTSGSVSSGATTVGLNDVSGYNNGEWVTLVIEPDVPSKKQVFHGKVDVSGSQITDVEWTEGTNTAHSAGVAVVDYETATAWALQAKGFGVAHDTDGKIKANAVDTTQIKDAAVITAKIKDGDVTDAKWRNGVAFRGTTTQSVPGFAVTAISTYTEVYDVGGNFNHTDGKFTAPVKGIYHFDGLVQMTDATGRLYLDPVKNASTRITSSMGYNGVGNGEVTAVVGFDVNLEANDTVRLDVNNQVSGSTTLDGNSYFSGHLVTRIA